MQDNNKGIFILSMMENFTPILLILLTYFCCPLYRVESEANVMKTMAMLMGKDWLLHLLVQGVVI